MGLFDSPASQVPLPNQPQQQVQGIGGTQSNVLNQIGNLGNFNQYAQYLPWAQQITGSLANSPYAAGAQAGANQAGQMGQQAGANLFGASGNLYGLGNNSFAAGNQLWNTAQDPQQALYNRTLQQTQDQTRAGQAARGVLTSPYGVGLENQAVNNFNMDWQNQQLQRQLQGLQGMNSAYGTGASLYNQAGQGQTQGVNAYTGASMLPYQVQQQIGNNQFGALSNLGNFGNAGAQLPQQQIADWQNYLGYGNQVAQTNNAQANAQAQLGLQQAQQGFQQNQQMFGGLGNLAGGIANVGMAFI